MVPKNKVELEVNAAVAKLVDALASGVSDRKVMGVRISPAAIQ